jgi:tetratricopeptide (TPR) repeat protein
MTLHPSLLRQRENPNLNRDQRARLRCELAREFEDKGEHESAREAMSGLWQRVGERPKVEGLEQSAAAEVLLRAGTLAGWIGSKNQITDAQETAKNLISESITIFESLAFGKKVAEAQIELAYCYWRQGAFDEARDILKEALSRLDIGSELKAKAIVRSAIVEWSALRHNESLCILIDAASLFETIENHTIKGGYHDALASVLEDIGTAERREDYIDRAFVEYAAASYHFERARHKCYRANVEHNLGYLYFKAGKFTEAHEHLERARRIVVSLKDSGTLAQYDETRARVFLAEGRNSEAEKAARASVVILEQGGQQGLLAEALITHGTALARLGYYSQSYATLQYAIEVARESGSLSRAGEAALILLEELGEHFTPRAVKMPIQTGMLKDARRYEHNLIKQALIDARGHLTQAARLLGTSRQHLSYLLGSRHKDLLSVRTPIIRRPKRK